MIPSATASAKDMKSKENRDETPVTSMENDAPDRPADRLRLHLPESAAVSFGRNRHGFPRRLHHAISAGRRRGSGHRNSGRPDFGFSHPFFAGGLRRQGALRLQGLDHHLRRDPAQRGHRLLCHRQRPEAAWAVLPSGGKDQSGQHRDPAPWTKTPFGSFNS